MPNAKHEDALLKMGVKYFQEHILKLIFKHKITPNKTLK